MATAIIHPHSQELKKQNALRETVIYFDYLSVEIAVQIYNEKLKAEIVNSEFSGKTRSDRFDVSVQKIENLPQIQTTEPRFSQPYQEFAKALSKLNDDIAQKFSIQLESTNQAIDDLVKTKQINKPVAEQMKQAFKETFSPETTQKVVNDALSATPTPRPTWTAKKEEEATKETSGAFVERVQQGYTEQFHKNMEKNSSQQNISQATQANINQFVLVQIGQFTAILVQTIEVHQRNFEQVCKGSNYEDNPFRMFQRSQAQSPSLEELVQLFKHRA